MDLLPLIVSLAIGLAVLLIILAVFGQSRNAASERLEQIVAPAAAAAAPAPTEKTSMRETVARSPLLSVPNRALERRSWSDRLARDLARADLTMRPIEYLLDSRRLRSSAWLPSSRSLATTSRFLGTGGC